MRDAARRLGAGRGVDHVPLRRLLDRVGAEALLEAATAPDTGGRLTLIETDGTAFAGHDDRLVPLTGRVRRALAGATDATGPVSIGKGLRVHPLLGRSRIVGGLVVRDPAAENTVDILRRSLSTMLGQALDLRDLGQETLDRYREINLLYRVGETIGASLDADEIPRLLLSEANSAIQADAAAVFIGLDGQPEVAASLGKARIVESTVEASGRLVDQVMATGQPQILAWPAGASPHLGAILCVPIRAQERPIGAVVICRREGRADFSAGDEKLLLAIASEGGVAYDRARLYEQKVQRERVDEELAIGRRMQLSLLPASSPDLPGWEFAAIYQAARQVGGDFYDFIQRPEAPGTIDLVIGDVTGKGVPAALLMASTRAVLRASAAGPGAPSAILQRTNQHILRDGRSGLFVTALYGTLDLKSGHLAFASGGHDPPLWFRGSGPRSHLLTTRSTILGAFSEIDLEDRRIALSPGDLLVLYTDGVTEARDGRGRLFGERRLRAIVTANAKGSAESTAQAVLGAVMDFIGEVPLSDDLTLLVVRRQAEP